MPPVNRSHVMSAVLATVVGCSTIASVTPFTASAADTLFLKSPRTPSRADDSFIRMFPGLPPFAAATDEMRDKAKKVGEAGGILDAMDLLTDPVQSITNPAVFSPNNPDNPNMTAGMTFLGQFIDHDLTLDPKSPLLQNADPRRTTNFRTAAFDLDSLYGQGPQDSPELYDRSSGDIKLRVDVLPGAEAVSRKGATRYDLPRDASNNAVIGDSRNDENVIISQFHVAMLRFHNAVIDNLRAKPELAKASPDRVFQMAQRLVQWHYQWIVLHEFLPITIGQGRVDDILRRGTTFYNGDDARFRNLRGNPQIPVEFSVAAYRFGHSQARPSYRLNFGPDGGNPFFVFIFEDSNDPNDPDPADLRGGKRAARRFVDWQTFFNFGDGNVRPNKRIDAKLSTPLMHLLGMRGPAPGMPQDGVQSLASRNLMRHVNFGLPSGQAIARVMGVQVLTPAQLTELQPYSMDRSTPLWYYILKEAQVLESGLRMGPVGARIVGEVFIGLLRADRSTYLSVDRNWKPTLPSATPGDFKVTDLLRLAGVVPPL
ncbi:Myeloperoxidase, thyroid peroxidase, cyclooxygenase catalytic domain [Nitrospira japonica]|uniref:Myeloperoxidase, thyroid peroxidase, cyclooxygenase catalytic domain n=1 Tax=Nitrospira japonica TaxID=1325564 RepID=A0A1W1I8A7_9BACT|nr:heme peroxidase family protein [Nitrospira japonica]SLM49278.1 Myeloperoxidase, thyroid peroxidase, cyclooxygenase catalytic domain [Nitrospira japonica]